MSAMEQASYTDDNITLTAEDYRALVTSFARLTWEADARGRFVADAPACRAFSGQSRESWFGEGWLAAVHPDDRDRVGHDWRQALHDQVSLTAPLRLRRRAGDYRSMTVHATPVREPGGAIKKWVGMLVEQGPEASMAAATPDSPAPGAPIKELPPQDSKDASTLLQAVLHAAPIALMAYEPVYAAGRLQDFRFIFLSAFGIRLTGYDTTGELLSKVFPTTLKNGVFDSLRKALERGKRQDTEIWYEGEGIKRWLRTVIVPAGGIVVAATEDVTDRKRAEQRLEANHRLFQNIIDAPDIGIAVYKAVRNEAGVITDFVHEFINRASFNMLGEDYTGKLLSEHGEIGTSQFNSFVEVLESGKGNDYLRNVTFRGRDTWFAITNRPLGLDRLVHTWEDVTERQRMQEDNLQLKVEAARTATNKYQYIFNSIEEGFCLYEVLYDESGYPHDLRWVDVNPAYERLTGLKDVVGKTHRELSLGTYQFWLDSLDQVVKSGEPARFENHHEPTGRWHTLSVFSTPELGRNQVGVVFADITERKRTEARQDFLLKINEALRTTEDPELIESTVCRLALEYFGSDRCFYCTVRDGEATVRHDAHGDGLSSVANSYPMAIYKTFSSVVEQGIPFAIEDVRESEIVDEGLRELCLQQTNVSLLNVPVVKQGTVVGLFCLTSCTPRTWTEFDKELATDTAERTWAAVERANAESALRESEERLRALVKNLPGGAVFVVNRDLYYILAEGEVLANSDVGSADFLDKHISEVLPRFDLEFYEGLYQRAFRGETFVYELETYGRTYVTRGIPLRRNESNEVYEVLVISYDITDRKRAEQALCVADRRKDEFLAMLAHELRNPMATIRAGLQILTTSENEAQPLPAPTLTMMTRQTNHLIRLVDDLLDVSRISRGQIELRKQSVDLVAVVAEAVASARALYFKRGKQLSVELPDGPILLRGDSTRLGQVVTNLLNNGIRYTSGSGKVWLSLERRGGGPTGRQAVLQVRDDGIGMTEEQLDSIFELFVQLDTSPGRAAGGLGIGLTLVRRLVEGHGGAVHARSQGLGKGSTFTVVLPVPEEQVDLADAPGIDPTGNSERILVIDDNSDAAETLAALLRLRGYDVLTAPDGNTGIATAETTQPRTILLDIGMPGLDGYETCRRIRRQTWGKSLQIIAVSGYGQQKDQQRAREAGFDAHLVKPVNLSTLVDLLNNPTHKSWPLY